MEMNLDTFIIAEIQRQRVPLRVVLNEADANYIITGVVQKTSRSTAGIVLGSVVGRQDKFEANAHLISVKSKELIWSGDAGDRSVLFSVLRRGGQRKIAKKIVKQLHNDLFANKVKAAKPAKPSRKPQRES
jgi:TolB-like protein